MENIFLPSKKNIWGNFSFISQLFICVSSWLMMGSLWNVCQVLSNERCSTFTSSSISVTHWILLKHPPNPQPKSQGIPTTTKKGGAEEFTVDWKVVYNMILIDVLCRNFPHFVVIFWGNEIGNSVNFGFFHRKIVTCQILIVFTPGLWMEMGSNHEMMD